MGVAAMRKRVRNKDTKRRCGPQISLNERGEAALRWFGLYVTTFSIF